MSSGSGTDRIYLNVEGEEFTSLSNFRKVYGDKADIALFQKAFGGPRQEILKRGITGPEKIELITALKKRIADLKSIHIGNSNILSNQVLRRMPFKLQKLIDTLGGLNTSVVNATATELAARGATLTTRIRTGNYDLQKILQIAWHLAHPDKINSGKYESWEAILNGVDGLTLPDIISGIGNAKTKSSLEGLTKSVSSILTNGDTLNVVTKSIADKIDKSTKTSEELTSVQQRFAEIIRVLKTHHYLYETEDGIIVDDKKFNKFKGDLHKKLSGYISTSTNLIFAYYKQVFGENFSILDTFIKNQFPSLKPDFPKPKMGETNAEKEVREAAEKEAMEKSYETNVDNLLNIIEGLTNTFYKPFSRSDPVIPSGIYRLDVLTSERLMPFLKSYDLSKKRMDDSLMAKNKPFLWFLPGDKIFKIDDTTLTLNVKKLIPKGSDVSITRDEPAATAAFKEFFEDSSPHVFIIVNDKFKEVTSETPCTLVDLDLNKIPSERISLIDTWNKWIRKVSKDATLSTLQFTKRTFPNFDLDTYVSMPVLQLCTLLAFKYELEEVEKIRNARKYKNSESGKKYEYR